MVCDEKDEIDIFEAWRDKKPIPEHVEWRGIITLEDIMEDIIQEEIADEFDDQSPLQAILESKQSKSMLHLPAEDKWTDDRSFVESVNARFNAKNMRTARAITTKLRRRSNFKLSQPPLSDHDVVSPFSKPLSVDDDGSIWDQMGKMGSHSQPELLTKPLLSNINTSLNVKQVQQQNTRMSMPQMGGYHEHEHE